LVFASLISLNWATGRVKASRFVHDLRGTHVGWGVGSTGAWLVGVKTGRWRLRSSQRSASVHNQRERNQQSGSLAGAAHSLKDNKSVLKRAQQEQKSCVDDKAKSSPDFILQYWNKTWKRGLTIL